MLLNVDNMFSFYIIVQTVLFPPFFVLKLNQYVPNLEAVDAKRIYPKEYTTWREDPANFSMNGRYPVRDLWEAARVCWKDILLSPVRFSLSLLLSFASIVLKANYQTYLILQGESFLIITHKSILRALTCTALGLGPER